MRGVTRFSTAFTDRKTLLTDSTHRRMKRIAKHATLVLVLLGPGACAVIDPDPREIHSIAFGTITPGSVESIPDWTMDLVRSCYAEGLRLDPNQEGSIAFEIHPPEQAGPVESRILDSSGLGTDLVECIRSSFGNIAHYVSGGRRQQPVSETLYLSRSVSRVCAPPTLKTVEDLASNYYRKHEVVEVTEVDLAGIEHRVSEFDPDRLLRFVFTDVELTFRGDGYEGFCVHGNEYKTFGIRPIETKGAGHLCESIHRRKGDRVRDTYVSIFELDEGKWREAYEGKAYCGDSRQ